MKKWMYVIFPGAMLALFLVVYSAHVKEARQKEQEHLAKQAADRKAEEEKKKEAERIAAIDAKKRQEEREAEERKKEEERRRKQEAIDKEVRDQTAQFKADSDKLAKQIADLQIQLDRLHKERDQLTREDLELAKQVELARVAKRNAELEEQRLTQMIALKADGSAMAQMPLPPPSK